MTVVAFRKPALAIGCTSCGATVDAACDCGAPYMPAGQRAAAAIAANPQMSDRAIAQQIGVSQPTVSRARRATETDVSVEDEPRIGLDGKTRRLPTRHHITTDDDDDEFSAKELAARDRGSFMLRAQEAKNFAFYTGRVDEKLLEFARGTAAAWCELVANMEKRA